MTSAAIKKELPYKNKGDLTTGPVHKHLIRLSVPMLWGIFSIISVQLADVYFISRLGTLELASISFIFPIALVLTHLSFGFSIAIASVVSRLIGEKKQEDVKRVVLHGLILAFSFSSSVALLCFFISPYMFEALGADEQARALINQYFPYWLISFAIMAIPVSGNSALRAAGNAIHPAVVMMSVALINLILDPLLIFGWYGFPELGVKGAAVATLSAYACGFVLGLFFLLRRKDLIGFSSLYVSDIKDSLKRLLIVALPASIANIIVPFTNTVIVGVLAVHGVSAVAGHGVTNRVEAFALIAVISLAVGMTPVIGQNWGARLYERVHKTLNLAIGFNMVWSLFIAFLLYVFAQEIAEAFSDDEDVIKVAVLFFKTVPVSYGFANLVLGWSSAFNAMGRSVRALVMMLVHASMLISGVFIGNNIGGVQGIFIAISAVNIIVGSFFHLLSWRSCLQLEQSEEK